MLYFRNDLVNKIVIKGNTKEFLEQHGIEYCYSNGKQIHLQYCRNYFEAHYSINSNAAMTNNGSSSANSTSRKSNKENPIQNQNILLIDDDVQNLKMAHENGHMVYQVNSSMKLVDFYNYLREKLSFSI